MISVCKTHFSIFPLWIPMGQIYSLCSCHSFFSPRADCCAKGLLGLLCTGTCKLHLKVELLTLVIQQSKAWFHKSFILQCFLPVCSIPPALNRSFAPPSQQTTLQIFILGCFLCREGCLGFVCCSQNSDKHPGGQPLAGLVLRECIHQINWD